MNKFKAAILAIALSTLPCIALADQYGNATPSPQMRAAFSVMQQAHAKMEQLHAQARLAALNSLTPAHRALLAQVVGQLAIAANPDVNAAARSIDNALSQNEGRSILNISSSLESQSRQIMEAARQQMMAANPNGQAGPGGPGGPAGPGGPWMGGHGFHQGMQGPQNSTPDPGMILLLMSTHALHPMGFHNRG
ncbi:MAG TPA: hypothetical protein VEJ41_01520 [Candidatus Acidoferrales bacterium]|nr:hypothetical protein [Candidatus Acidoferrales bacterium]